MVKIVHKLCGTLQINCNILLHFAADRDEARKEVL